MSAGAERTDRRAAAERLAAHSDCVDLVDEDDALAAPLAGEPFRLPGEVADDDRVDADEGLSEAGARDRDEWGVEPGRDRFREHRLTGSGCAEKEQSALPLSSRPLESLARLPERDDPPNLLLGLHLATDVLELDSPLRVPWLEAPDLGDAHQQHRAHEDRKVGDEQERDEDDLREHRRVRERRQEPFDHVDDGAPPRAAADQPDDGDHAFRTRSRTAPSSANTTRAAARSRPRRAAAGCRRRRGWATESACGRADPRSRGTRSRRRASPEATRACSSRCTA